MQCDAMRRGLATVVPIHVLSILSWRELERQVEAAACGPIDAIRGRDTRCLL